MQMGTKMKKKKMIEMNNLNPWPWVVSALVIFGVSWVIVGQVKEKENETLIARRQVYPNAQLVAKYMRESFSGAVATIKPAVVSISSLHLPDIREAGGKSRSYQEIGAGFFINHQGYLLTNYHVIAGADEIKITRFDGDHNHFYNGQVIKEYPDIDLALLKVHSNEIFPVAILGNSDGIKVGDWVLAIGSPFGLDQSVTAGIISAKRQSLFIKGAEYGGLIQTDAPINPGNSGGPLVNIKGQVIGINTAISASPQTTRDLGFAIPINDIKIILRNMGMPYSR